MDSQAIAKLTKEAVSRLTSDEYLAAHNDPTTGKDFAAKINQLDSQPRTAIPARTDGRVRQDDAPSPRADFRGDPSWSDVDDQPAPAAAAVAQPAAVAEPSAELPEKIHRYQPVDRNGKKVGGEQIFKYRTDAELIEKLTKAHSASSARIRELSRDRKLDEIVSSGSTEKNFTPSTEVPKTMEELAQELLEQRQQNFLLSVREALNAFQLSADWAKYRGNPENAKSIVLAVERAGDSPADPASYHRAFANMQQFLEPVVAEPVAVVPAPAPAPVAVASVRPRSTPLIATGLSNADGGNDYTPTAPLGQTPKGIVVDGVRVTSIAQWDKIPSSKQRRILMQPALNLIVNQMYEQQAAVRSGR
jgi:hypothetical protein